MAQARLAPDRGQNTFRLPKCIGQKAEQPETSHEIASSSRLRTHVPAFDNLLPANKCSPSPMSVLEASILFRPATYTQEERRPKILNYYIQETQATDHFRVTQLAMHYRHASGSWLRITATVETTADSSYWKLVRTQTLELGLNDRLSSKICLSARLKAFLTTCEKVDQDYRVELFLGSGNGVNIRAIEKFAPPHDSMGQGSLDSARKYMEKITEDVCHWGVPWFWDHELEQYPMFKIRKVENPFFAFLRSRWVLATRFSSDVSNIESQLYALRAMHAARGSPGVSKLLGIVVDNNTKLVSGYLSELPATGRLKNVMEGYARLKQSASMERRLKWCRQVIDGVASMHSKGFTIGYLGESSMKCVAVDHEDNALLYRLIQPQWCASSVDPKIPYAEDLGLERNGGPLTATFQSDLYQLGLLLWRIVEHKHFPGQHFCKIVGCDTHKSKKCTAPHADPVQLPGIDENVPQFMRDVISICRSEDPSQRVPAWALLSKFPVPEEKDGISRERVAKEIRIERLEDCYERHGPCTTCDNCAAECEARYFHCNVCLHSNYDLCPPCYFGGNHCFDEKHILHEVREGSNW